MGKTSKTKERLQKKMAARKMENLPFVSVCTPTFNRRPFIPAMLEIFRQQDYPKDKMEWIIIDDGTDSIRDLIEAANIPQIKYFYSSQKWFLVKNEIFFTKSRVERLSFIWTTMIIIQEIVYLMR